MFRGLGRRVQALFFLVAFTVGGFGLPVADELLYHSGKSATALAEVDHFDSAGGCGSHAEHCVLSSFSSVRQLPVRDSPSLRIDTVSHADASFRLVVLLQSVDRSLLQPSRAPPVSAS